MGAGFSVVQFPQCRKTVSKPRGRTVLVRDEHFEVEVFDKAYAEDASRVLEWMNGGRSPANRVRTLLMGPFRESTIWSQ